MSKAPSYSMHTVRFRDAADSGKFNDHTSELFYDLTELFNIANQQEAETERIREFFEVSSYFSHRQLQTLQEELANLRQFVQELQGSGKEYVKRIYSTSMKLDADVPEFEQAVIDPIHGIVTLRPSSHSNSKLYLYDEINSEYIVPSTLEYTITPAADGSIIQENDFANAITPDENMFWHRKYNYTTQQEASCQIVIKLPDNIISSRDVNTIYLHPFPLNAVDIVNVEYQLNGGWKAVPGFEPIEKAGNVKFCFSPTAMSEVRITLRQRSFIEKGGKRVFHIGLRDVGIFYYDYQSSIGRFDIEVDLNERFAKKQIVDIQPIYQNESTLSVHQTNTRLLTFKVYEVDSTGRATYLNDRFPLTIEKNKVLLKGVLSYDRNNQTTPALAGIELTFKGDS